MSAEFKIGTRFTFGFYLVLLCVIALFSLGLWRMSDWRDSRNVVVIGKVANLVNTMDMREGGWELAVALHEIVTPTDAMEREQETKKLVRILEKIAKSEENLKSLATSAEGKAALAAATKERQTLLPVIELIKTLINGGNHFGGALVLKTDFLPLHQKWMTSLETLTENLQNEVTLTYVASQQNYRSTRMGIFAIGVLAFVLVVFVVSWKLAGTADEY